MSGFNQWIGIGNLTRDPEIRYTQSNTAVANFSIACNRTWRDQGGEKHEDVEYVKCVAWGRTAEVCSQYLHKGSRVQVVGRLQTQEWEDKNQQKRKTTEVVVASMLMLGDPQRGQQNGAPGQSPGRAQGESTAPAGAPAAADASGANQGQPSAPWNGPEGPPPPDDDDLPF